MDSITLNCQHCIKPFSCPGVGKYCTRLIRLPYRVQHLLSVTYIINVPVFRNFKTKKGGGGKVNEASLKSVFTLLIITLEENM